MKKFLLLLLSLIMVFSLIACADLGDGESNESAENEEENEKPGDNTNTCSHTDVNHDGVCDIDSCKKRGLSVNHIDSNHDGVCDVYACKAAGLTVSHIDANNDTKCDVCGVNLNNGGNVNPCQHRDLNHDGVCDLCRVGGLAVSHADVNGDYICDVCGVNLNNGGNVNPCQHIDANHDGRCDTAGCGAAMTVNHVDENHDGRCDVAACRATGLAVTHTDENNDGRCDVCNRINSTSVCTNHEDRNHDGRCDTSSCGAAMTVNHVDVNHDGRCDVAACRATGLAVNHIDENNDYYCDSAYCSNPYIAHDHIDEDSDYICDLCGEYTDYEDHECIDEMPRDGICDYAFCDAAVEASPCPDGEHIDYAGDGICDVCETEFTCAHDFGENSEYPECAICLAPNPDYIEEEIVYPWDTTTLIMEVTEHTQNGELLSVSKKYLAGEDNTASDDIAVSVRQRNALAEITTKTNVTYKYLPDTSEYSWGTNIDRITLDVRRGGTDATDIYCNFVYDMVGASLRQCFANLLADRISAVRGTNYFEFLDEDYAPETNDRGYMYEYMQSLTLAPNKKMYVLASDYFIDMVRAFFCVPVNIKIMEESGAVIVAQNEEGEIAYAGGDRNGDGEFTLDDFYELVKAGEWTYDTLAKFAAEVYTPSATNDGSVNIGDDIVGFAMANGGLAASGLLYTASVEIIKKEANGDGTYNYTYPADNQDFYAFCDATTRLFGESTGICIVDKNYTTYGDTSLKAIRKRFSQDKVLFGDITLVGALEFSEYQEMKDGKGFGVVPVPLYRSGSNDKYRTQIHNIGSCGAISIITKKFSQCTAFLNYQSTHSEEILNNYYRYKLQHDIAGGSTGTVEMLQYIRDNVSSSLDKSMEDALGVFNTEANRSKWHNVLQGYKFQVDIRIEYQSTYSAKQQYLDDLAAAFQRFPD